MLVGKREVFNQCEEFIENRLPGVSEMSVLDVGQAIADVITSYSIHYTKLYEA